MDRLSKGFAQTLHRRFKEAATYLISRLRPGMPLVQILEMRDHLRRMFEGVMKESIEQYISFAIYEAQFIKKRFKDQHSVEMRLPSNDQLREAVLNAKIKTTIDKTPLVMAIAFLVFVDKKTGDMIQVVKDSQSNQEEVKVTENKLQALVAGAILTHLLLMSSLATLTVANSARVEVYKMNPEKIRYVQWFSVLEDNTCPYCESLHEQIYPVGMAPAFPAHARCQCSLLPVIDESILQLYGLLEPEFLKEIHGDARPIRFRDRKDVAITLEQLKQLDDCFIHGAVPHPRSENNNE